MFDVHSCILRFKAGTTGCRASFLNHDAEEDIYIWVLQGLEIPDEFNKGEFALRLLKGLDSLKQATRLWNNAVNARLHCLNLINCYCDPCLYVMTEITSF